MEQSRKSLSAEGLLTIAKQSFSKIIDNKGKTKISMQLSDCLMSALAVFSLKFPSLLKFDTEHKQDEMLQNNIKTLYQVKQVPCDTYMRERLDEVNPTDIRKSFKIMFAEVQRGKLLEPYTYMNGAYLMPIDGTGFFGSTAVHCDNCCIKEHNKCHLKIVDVYPDEGEYKKNTYFLIENKGQTERRLLFVDSKKEICDYKIRDIPGLEKVIYHIDRYETHKGRKRDILQVLTQHYEENHKQESTSYYHNMLCGAIVHPDMKTVIPFAPEPILKGDGAKKNDSEHNAIKRFLADFRREHPHLKIIVVQDAIAANYPNLNTIKRANMSFIVGAKPGSNKSLFAIVKDSKCREYTQVTEDETTHRYKYLNSVSLNKANPDFKVNFMEYRSEDKKGNKLKFCWVTDIEITDNNCYDIMRGGRANWKIENNTFNTLKNQGYQFEHNFGHGHKNLSTVFGMLMVLAFLIDQIQQQACKMWQKARASYTSRSGLFDKVRILFTAYFINSWHDLYSAISDGHSGAVLAPNTS